MNFLKTTGWLFPLVLLAGCEAASENSSRVAAVRGVELPALPIIQGAVGGLVPTLDGKRNDMMMRQVCALARSEITQEQVEQTMLQQGIDLKKIPQQGHPLSLLTNTDLSLRMTACAAYIATSVMILPKTSEFMVEVGTTDPEKSKVISIDSQKLNKFLSVQLAVAKADADLFALIASELEKSPGLTVDQYKRRAQISFAMIAPAYLQLVKNFYVSANENVYTLLEYSERNFNFRSSDGYLFVLGFGGLSLSFDKVPWYGAGKLLGKTYMLDVAYFDLELIKLVRGARAD